MGSNKMGWDGVCFDEVGCEGMGGHVQSCHMMRCDEKCDVVWCGVALWRM
jgi:hypothetical protein